MVTTWMQGALGRARRMHVRIRRAFDHKSNRGKSPEQIFTSVYARGVWGGGLQDLSSGSGTHDREVAATYVAAVTSEIRRLGLQGKRFLDLGCGDFHIGQQLASLSTHYIGVDVVQPVIARNRVLFGGPSIAFEQLDITRDPLPSADVCFLRQVLQHMSNNEIRTLLPKLTAYPVVFVTEHYPSDGRCESPNRDKGTGADIRLYDKSGVYLDLAPFNVPRDQLKLVCEVASPPMGSWRDAGVIRTFKWTPEAESR